MDRERLDLLLSLNGKPVPNHYFQGEVILKQHMAKMDKLMKEQSARLLDERTLMKAEWDKVRCMSYIYLCPIFASLIHILYEYII